MEVEFDPNLKCYMDTFGGKINHLNPEFIAELKKLDAQADAGTQSGKLKPMARAERRKAFGLE